MRDVAALSHDEVIVSMAQDVLDGFGPEDGRLALAEDGVSEDASFTYLVRGGDTETAEPEDILPAVVAAFERLAAS